jgi:hypothetical protein
MGELKESLGPIGINLDLLGEKNLESLEKSQTDDQVDNKTYINQMPSL